MRRRIGWRNRKRGRSCSRGRNYLPCLVSGEWKAESAQLRLLCEFRGAALNPFTHSFLSIASPFVAYIYGFDRHFLQAVRDFTQSDSCPVLSTEGLALAGLVECAGGVLEATEYDFLMQTRSNHREKKLDKPGVPLRAWRTYDAYNGCNTPGMLQEAFDAYYGKLKTPEPAKA